jgi:hypothetical protein
MSMNLCVEFDGRQFELRQTPTSVTRMCLVDAEGCCSTRTGNKAKRAIQIYKQWLLGTLNGVWFTQEELDDARNSVNDHLNELLTDMARAKIIEAYMI